MSSDHDLLIRIDQNLTNLVDAFKAHITQDEGSFATIRTDMEAVKKVNESFKRYLWMAMGAIAVIEMAVRIIFARG